MCSRFLSLLAALLVMAAAAGGATLRVCADPDNLPYSNRKQQGFENRIAEVIAHELNAKLEYEWQRMGRGFVRDVLNKGKCDVLLGIPTQFRPVLTTKPYYRSAYVFVSRRGDRHHFTSFDDPKLRNAKVGVQIVSEEYAPPGRALGRRGLIANVVGFQTGGASSASIMTAVLKDQVDAAVVWGPLAGYIAKRYPGKFDLAPTPQVDPPIPLAFSISLGVRKKDVDLRERLDRALERRRPEIKRILDLYGVPRVSEPAEGAR